MDPDRDPAPDPTPFFIDFKDAKIFFIFCKNFVFKFYFAGIISVRSTH